MGQQSFFAELRQRKVVQVAAIYGAVAWGVTEVLVTIVDRLFLPQWVATVAVIGFVVGFPIAMFLAWTFDITADGIQRTTLTSRRGTISIVLSLLLLVASTAGLFFLIKPGLQVQQPVSQAPDALPNSVAVLPFTYDGDDTENVYLGEGLSDELRDQLGRVPGLRIAARSSSISAAEQGMDAMAASEHLGVAHVVEGNLRRQGDRLRASVQFIEGSSGLSLWSESYERGPDELLKVQQAIAERIIAQILPEADVDLTPATLDATANELMLLARHYDQQVREQQITNVEKLMRAIELYRDAIEADPESALAHSRLAGALLFLGDLEAAEAPIFRALSLDPNLSEVQNTLGEFYWAKGRPEAATAFARAVELNPNNADALQNYATRLWMSADPHSTGIEDLALLYQRAVNLDPLSMDRHAALGDYLGKVGRIEETKAVIRNISKLFEGAESYRLVAWLKELTGEYDEAIAWTIRARNQEPDNHDHTAKLAELYTLLGGSETALRLEPDPGVGLLFLMRKYPELIDSAEFRMIEEPNDMDVRYLLAFAHQATGEFESAIHILASTGLPDSFATARSVLEVEGFITLLNALDGLATDDSEGIATMLATNLLEGPLHGEIGWVSLYMGCTMAIVGQDEEALQTLRGLKESARLPLQPAIRDLHCFQKFREHPVYVDILNYVDARRAALRKRLPATLTEFGVEL